MKVNGKYKSNMALAECAAACTDKCTGFGYSADANNGECLIYGPGFSGSCSDASATSPDACAALGSCSNADQTHETTCGSCSAVASTVADCEQVGGVWTAATWTSAGESWIEPGDGYTIDYHDTVLVTMVDESDTYACYDKDPTDHHPKCEGAENCTAAFDGKPIEEKLVGNCPDGCTFTPEVVMGKPKVPHDQLFNSMAGQLWPAFV